MKSLVFIILLFLVTACLQTPGNNRRVSLLNNATTGAVGTAKTPAGLPVFTQGVNYFQNGGQIYTTGLPLSLDFIDIIYLRGKDVDTYIRTTGTQTAACLVSPFSTAGKTLVVSAMPQSIYNYTNQSIEYFYAISFSDKVSNQNFCNKPGLTIALNQSLIYDMISLCNNRLCNSSYSTQNFSLYNIAGTTLSQINLKNLSLVLSPAIANNNGASTTCVTNSQCSSIGFNCCSNGQCVKDLALKGGIDQTTPNYKQALQDILNNPSHIYLYPNYYFICSIPVNQPTIPGTGTNPTNAAMIHLKKLENLYNCTNKLVGEAGICSKTFPQALTNTAYSVGVDDQNFSTTYENLNPLSNTLVSITDVLYGDVSLFNFADKNETDLTSYVYRDATITIAGQHNNDLTTGAQVTLLNLPPTTLSPDLEVKYLVDASCSEINPTLGKCEKYYVQGQKNNGTTIRDNRLGRVTDHFPSSNFFKLPYYANSSQAFTVEVDGVVLQQNTDWQLNQVSPLTIQLLTTNGSLKAFDTQLVKISFFVNLTVYNVMASKKAALTEIQTMCSCPDLRCSLTPIKNAVDIVTDYACVYPNPPAQTAPLSQLVYLSSKTVPVRYFDIKGASQTVITGSTPAQEGRPFSYINNDPLVPNNMPSATITDPYVGFNEIYGSLSYAPNSAKPAKEVVVNIGKSYDIYVDRGAYSTCIQCGNDYYTQLNTLFPLAQFGSGLVPDRAQTLNTIRGSRADDYSFGRACFVPASMIPWTHSIASITADQRLNRLRAQHFLYANGYQRDWFGFNYGSVIGSFDGVKWFSIGSNRKIKATTNKLFLAINGAMGDLTIESTYNVTINDSTLNPAGTGLATTDIDSDGAQCQRFHQCRNDNDCATTLGWDYTCAAINDATSPWPVFDANGSEIPNAQLADNRLISILGISAGGRRCVYRGRGSACTPDSSSTALTNLVGAFNASLSESFHVCSNNNFCQAISTPNSFNNRIARFGKVKLDIAVDSVGFGARTPLRPLDYQGQETIRTEALKNLNSNRVTGVCKPGRNPEVAIASQNATSPTTVGKFYEGDKILGMGMSYQKGTTAANPNYLSSCSIVDDLKNYYYSNIAGGTFNLKENSGSQAISTNALSVFAGIFTTKQMNFTLLTPPTQIINAATFQENRCLRAPGASCFQDLECAPSKIIADQIKLILDADLAGTSVHSAELKFWQEDLVCSQAMPKTDPLYDPMRNICCREVGKTISIESSTSPTVLAQTQVAGIDFVMNAPQRYSRIATIYKDLYPLATSTYPPMAIAAANACTGGTCPNISTLASQYRTLALLAEKTSCSGHWVRNFATGVNNHKWDKSSLQTIDASNFRCLNWKPNTTNNSCLGIAYGLADCKCMNTPPERPKAKAVFAFLGKLELTGIPQIAVESEAFYNSTVEGDMSCLSNPNNAADMTYPNPFGTPAVMTGSYQVPPNIFAATPTAAEYSGVSNYYAANNAAHFASGIKQIFKANEVVACIPTGTTMALTDDPNRCCSGFIDGTRGKCALPDFVDVSVYTNRYVSSAANILPKNSFDTNTGYITDPALVANLACQLQLCASGTLVPGVLLSNMVITGWENFNKPEQKISRFLEGVPASDDASGMLSLYKQGLKINSHLYCFPKASAAAATTAGLPVTACGY
jgi:hypothetical protein